MGKSSKNPETAVNMPIITYVLYTIGVKGQQQQGDLKQDDASCLLPQQERDGGGGVFSNSYSQVRPVTTEYS